MDLRFSRYRPVGGEGFPRFPYSSITSPHLGSSWRTFPAVVFVIAFMPVASFADLIDDWSDGGVGQVRAVLDSTQDPPVNENPDSAVEDDTIDGEDNFLGIDREDFVEITNSQDGSATVNISGNSFSLNNDVNITARARFIWDGNADVVNPDNDIFAGSIDTDGLGGIDLAPADACGTGIAATAIRFAVSPSTQGTVRIRLAIWDTSNNFHEEEIQRPNGAASGVIQFSFADFTAASVDIGAVGAIRLQLITEGTGEDVQLSPLSTCPFDFGDASAFLQTGVPPDQDFSILDSRFEGSGPHHVATGPRLGGARDFDDAVGFNAESNSVAKADLDDDSGPTPDDEAAISFPDSVSGFDAGDTFTVEVNVQNVQSATPLLCGWIDFSDMDQQSGFGFDNGDERSCVFVSQADPDPDPAGSGSSCLDQGSGQFNCSLNFTIPDDWNGDNGDPGGTDSAFVSRFRVTTDWVSAANADFEGFASDGEVEDHLIDADTLPVSIHSFDSRFTAAGLALEWGTVSETRNVGFFVWADLGRGLELLTPEIIPAKSVDPVRPHRYSHTVPGLFQGQVSDLAITAVDHEGKEEVFGLFQPGKGYGKRLDPAMIGWPQIRAQLRERLNLRAVRAESATARKSSGSALISARTAPADEIRAVDIVTSAPGLTEVTWQDLVDAGLDLTGVAPGSIAVMLKGEAIARDIVIADLNAADSARQQYSLSTVLAESRSSAVFGPGSAIRFWSEEPKLPDALYLESYTYRISLDPARAKNASVENSKAKPGPENTLAHLHQDVDSAYSFGSPLADPWYAARLRADRDNVHEAVFEIDDALVASGRGRIAVVVAGLTDFPASPDHQIQVEVNGQLLVDDTFEGQAVRKLVADVPGGLLNTGANTVRVVAPGGTDAQFDISLVDTVTLSYSRELLAQNDRLLLQDIEHTGGLTVSGLTTLETVAYAWDGYNLVRLVREQFSRGSVRVPTVASEHADYWISSSARMRRPAEILAVPSTQLLDGISADLIVIAHPVFLPLSVEEPHPLNEYLDARRAEGWMPAVFDITQIQQQFGHGMPLPDAVTRFLRAADEQFEFEHVLLVGGDSYDYTDNLGLGSISFIPTRYAPTRLVPHTPSDNLLADLDGDGVSDKALGRWPVRSFGDLQAIVTKTLDWSANPDPLNNAAWIVDTQDPDQPSFASQVERMVEPLLAAGWSGDSIEQIFLGEVSPPPGTTAVDAARQAYFDRLETGPSLSGFVGHGAPAMWTFQGLLTPDDINGLFNEGSPTLIGTLTCFTSYFVSPFSDTVAHRWMNGYREDASGERIEGVSNGAVAIHGAAALSNYDQNEWFARNVLERQLAGLTLGQAVQDVRELASPSSDQVTNWTLLGDPTITIQQ